MNYVKCIDKSKLWIALAVMAVALFMWGYHGDVSAATGEETETTNKKDFSDEKNKDIFTFEVKDQTYTYTGNPICPEITVKEKVTDDTSGETGENSPNADPQEGETSSNDTTKTLELNKDYKVAYSNNTDVRADEKAPAPTITVEGMGDYTGKVELTFTIKPVDINNLELKISEKTYKGIAQRPDVSLYFNGKRLTRSKDYHVGHYKNNMDVGTATCLVKGDGNFTGSRTAEFKINPKNIYGLSFSDISIITYNGVAITPKVTIVDQAISPAKTLTQNKEYTLSYIDNNKVGTAGVIISGMGNYSGSKIITFKIRPKATTLVKLTKGKKKIKVKWTKQTTQVTGYQIQYSTSSKFTGAKSVTVKKTYSTKTLTKLKGKKKYYVRVRTYKSVAGIKYYSKWSNVKAITTKK